MKTADGETMFCPGCPNRGAFVGPLNPETTMNCTVIYPGEIAHARGQWMPNTDLIARVEFIDDTQGKTAFFDSSVYSSEAAGEVLAKAWDGSHRRSNQVDRKVVSSLVAIKPKILERIGHCIAGQSFEARRCPALNPEVTRTLLKEAVVQLRPRQAS